jgi:hypothetical protein
MCVIFIIISYIISSHKIHESPISNVHFSLPLNPHKIHESPISNVHFSLPLNPHRKEDNLAFLKGTLFSFPTDRHDLTILSGQSDQLVTFISETNQCWLCPAVAAKNMIGSCGDLTWTTTWRSWGTWRQEVIMTNIVPVQGQWLYFVWQFLAATLSFLCIMIH